MLALVLATALSATPAPAGAAGPGFDCARAGAPDERLICQAPELAALDRRVAVLYSWRVGLAEDDAQRSAERGVQRAWLGQRAACVAAKRAPARPEQLACLRELYAARAAALEDEVGAVPDAILVLRAQVSSKDGCEALDVSWPELQATSLRGAAAFNAFFSEKPRPPDCYGPDEPGAELAEHFRSSTLTWKDERYVTWERSTGGFTPGAAHGHRSTELVTFDLVEGRVVGPDDVFSAQAAVRERLVALLRERFRAHGKEPMPRLLSEEAFGRGRWGFTAGAALVHFSPYQIASYADGDFDATFTWEELRPFLRAGAPFPLARR